MLIETLVLDRHEGFAQIVGNFIHAYGETVGVGADILVDLIAFLIIYDGGFTNGYNIGQPDRGSGREDATESTDTGGYAADADTDKSCQHDLDTGQSNFPSPFL